ncbi:MAG: hypothetical protein KGJ62_07850 [Armatimonadetes bacterium]|nr:hypothetical protein [Armatimonadota bacterium]MDE2205189.1 hypothetical protein [Armatimonadota bacterium]
MKLRVRGDSIRMRLTRTEVERLTTAGEVHDAVHFDSGSAVMAYAIQTCANVAVAWAEFTDGTLRVIADRETIRLWASSDEVALQWNGTLPAILIEKDFACLQPRVDEDRADLFPNPHADRCS